MSSSTRPAVVRAADVLHAGDADPVRLLGFFDGETVFQMANNSPVTGRAAIERWMGEYLQGISGVSHELIETWERDDSIATLVEVTYTGESGGRVRLPAMTLMRFSGEYLAEYRIFMDPSPVRELSGASPNDS
ncbi:nuclear transport factor 2 family protein [Acrocarpospora catenulata]|uniref:nuclear transport factor 2 family protein n=1 Tax=Acrocarpospora catenulata TaxID=2836182 RepID=UPI001BD9C292|nr:nuclear transport factor 2 family protein [Acrocarpospora catenulata]